MLKGADQVRLSRTQVPYAGKSPVVGDAAKIDRITIGNRKARAESFYQFWIRRKKPMRTTVVRFVAFLVLFREPGMSLGNCGLKRSFSFSIQRERLALLDSNRFQFVNHYTIALEPRLVLDDAVQRLEETPIIRNG